MTPDVHRCVFNFDAVIANLYYCQPILSTLASQYLSVILTCMPESSTVGFFPCHVWRGGKVWIAKVWLRSVNLTFAQNTNTSSSWVRFYNPYNWLLLTIDKVWYRPPIHNTTRWHASPAPVDIALGCVFSYLNNRTRHYKQPLGVWDNLVSDRVDVCHPSNPHATGRWSRSSRPSWISYLSCPVRLSAWHPDRTCTVWNSGQFHELANCVLYVYRRPEYCPGWCIHVASGLSSEEPWSILPRDISFHGEIHYHRTSGQPDHVNKLGCQRMLHQLVGDPHVSTRWTPI